MPMDLNLYPDDWAEKAFSLKENAQWRCQGCGRDCVRPGENIMGFAKRLLMSKQPDVGIVTMRNVGVIFENQKRWELQACHKDQDPGNNAPENLIALCTGCHRTLDNGSSQRFVRAWLRAERCGQLALF